MAASPSVIYPAINKGAERTDLTSLGVCECPSGADFSDAFFGPRSEKELLDWLGLYLVPGMGAYSFNALLEAFSSPEAVFAADEAQRRERLPFLRDSLSRALSLGPSRDAAERQLEKCLKSGVRVLHESFAGYPVALRSLNVPPPFLFVKGGLMDSDIRAAAVVGTRNPSLQGSQAANEMAEELALYGFTIVSGLALGIDTLAHEAALKKEKRTIAVAGVGFDQIYPPENANLFHRIVEQGAVISEYPFGSQVRRSHFPRRNRIISGLSRAVLVVEAGADSGALITADFARKQGRPVFALPGAYYSKEAQGTNDLVRRGAGVICSVDDLLAYFEKLHRAPAPLNPEQGKELFLGKGYLQLRPRRKRMAREVSGISVFPNPELSPTEKTIAALLEKGPLSFDKLLEETKIRSDSTSTAAAATLPTLLLRLEIKRVIKKEPGARYALA